MGRKEVMNANIQPFTLSNIQIKEKIENVISYTNSKYKKVEILFKKKNTNVYKLPFSDFKVAISQENEEHELLIEELQIKHPLIENNLMIPQKEEIFEPTIEDIKTVIVNEDPEINVLDEIYDFDEEGKKPLKERYRSKIKQVDTDAIIKKIKEEAIEKNKGKKVVSFRDINKELKPYILKKRNGIDNEENTLTSIDIYLNAVNKIETNNLNIPVNDLSLDIDINDISDDSKK